MQNGEIQQVRINVVEMLLEACKDEPEKMYERVEKCLKNLQASLQQNKKFYEQEYRGNTN